MFGGLPFNEPDSGFPHLSDGRLFSAVEETQTSSEFANDLSVAAASESQPDCSVD